jgi:hypothetical protein
MQGMIERRYLNRQSLVALATATRIQTRGRAAAFSLVLEIEIR